MTHLSDKAKKRCWVLFHNWETVERWTIRVFDDYVSYDTPAYYKYFVRQSCTKCGKEVVRRYIS